MRNSHFDRDNFVAALAGILCIFNSAFPHAQLLTALRAGWNFELRAAIDGGHLHFGAQRCFGYRNRHGDLNVIADSRENRMRAGANDQEQVTGRPAIEADISLPRQPNALAIASAGLDAEFDGFGSRDHAFSVAGRARIRKVARAIAARAGDVELHAAAHLRNLAGAVALRACGRAAGVRLAVAGGTDFLAIDLQAHLSAADGGPEIHGDLVFEVGARLRSVRTLRLASARKYPGKNIFETTPATRWGP